VYEDDLIFSSPEEKAKFEGSQPEADSDTAVTITASTGSDIGPELPPHLRQMQSTTSSSDDIGPQLPPHLRQPTAETSSEQQIEPETAEKRKVDMNTTEAIAASSTHAEKRQRIE
jgi:hypothetical protein